MVTGIKLIVPGKLWLVMYVDVCMCVSVYACVYVSVCVSVYAYVHVYVCVSMGMCESGYV